MKVFFLCGHVGLTEWCVYKYVQCSLRFDSVPIIKFSNSVPWIFILFPLHTWWDQMHRNSIMEFLFSLSTFLWGVSLHIYTFHPIQMTSYWLLATAIQMLFISEIILIECSFNVRWSVFRITIWIYLFVCIVLTVLTVFVYLFVESHKRNQVFYKKNYYYR